LPGIGAGTSWFTVVASSLGEGAPLGGGVLGLVVAPGAALDPGNAGTVGPLPSEPLPSGSEEQALAASRVRRSAAERYEDFTLPC